MTDSIEWMFGSNFVLMGVSRKTGYWYIVRNVCNAWDVVAKYSVMIQSPDGEGWQDTCCVGTMLEMVIWCMNYDVDIECP